jgi:hypothetical protein
MVLQATQEGMSMMYLRQSLRAIAVCMAIVMLMTSLPFNFAQAAMVTTDQVVAQAEVAGERARVMRFMAREDVRQQLQALGIDSDEAARRTESLSDDEIQQIAQKLDELPAGQSAIGVLVVIILVLFLVLVITDLTGVTDVFPFINKVE